MNSYYTNITNYANDSRLVARTETIVSRNDRDTRTVFVPADAPEYKIPARDELVLDPQKIAEAKASAEWIMSIFGK